METKEEGKGKQREREKERDIIHLLIFLLSGCSSYGPGQSRDPGTSSWCSKWLAMAQAFGPSSTAFPCVAAGSWIRNLMWIASVTSGILTGAPQYWSPNFLKL